eukprot:gene2013-17573_t
MEKNSLFVQFLCMIILSLVQCLVAGVAHTGNGNGDNLLRVADSYIHGWKDFAVDTKLSPILSKLIVDPSSGNVHIDRSLYCELKGLHRTIAVSSFKSTKFGKKLKLIRSIPLLDHNLNCSNDTRTLDVAHPEHENLDFLFLPRNVFFDSATVDFLSSFSEYARKTHGNSVFMKFENCKQSVPFFGATLIVNSHLSKVLERCSPNYPMLLRMQVMRNGFIVEEKGIVIVAEKHANGMLKTHRRGRRSTPTFPRPYYSLKIPENMPVGTTIITLNVEPSSVPGLDIAYSISPSSIGFSINSKTGAVTISRSPDYEAMQTKKYFNLFVRTSFAETRLVIQIVDVNDNTPEFEQNPYTRTVSEATPSSASILEVKAIDKDSGRNGDVTYSLKNPGGINSAFEVDSYSGQVFLRNTRLDRETSPRYELIIVAEDDGTPKKSSETKVIITVSDINDNSPVFDKPEYTHTISENTNPGTILLRVKANDKDEGTNSKLSYSIYNDFTNPVVSKFEIGRATGDVILKQQLDYENELERSVRFTVEASDAGIPAKKGTAFVNIILEDFNDNSPIFRQGCTKYVLESASKGETVCTVSAADLDASLPNNEIVYSFGQAPDNLPFIVDPASGQVKVSKKLDFDNPSTRKFEFTIIATDKGVPPKSTSIVAKITLKNVNDNLPVFSKQSYHVSVPETTKPATSILELSASDIDQPDNNEFQFSIIKGNEKNCFSISDGKIFVQCNLNFDTDKIFNLTVQVKDSGQLGQQLSSTTFAVIQVIDANTHVPYFLPITSVPSVREDAPVGTLVLNVSARDLDFGENGRISYSIINSDGYFKINAVTGEIRTLKKLNSENTVKHELTIMARDHGLPVKSSTMQLIIGVTDVNDNAPVFRRKEYVVDVKESIEIGSMILRVRATDADTGSNNRAVVYKIPKGFDGNGTFYIQTDGYYGTLRTKKRLDRETVDSYTLKVQAFDKGTPPLNSSTIVKVKVQDVMDSPPVFKQKRYNITLKENYQSNVVFMRVTAKSADFNTDNEIFYQISRGSGGSDFFIEGSSGKISLRQGHTLDYEKQRQYVFDVIAYYGQTTFTDTTVVNVTLTDLNDNSPSLRPFEAFLNFFEDKFPKNPVFKIPAEDKDVNDILKYEIVGGEGKDFVTLDSKTGILTFNKNTENLGSEVRINVRVTDGVFEDVSHGFITATMISSDMVNNTIRIVLNNMTEDSFLNSKSINAFKDAFAAAVGCSRRLVFIVGVENYLLFLHEDQTPKVQISVAARASTGGSFLNPSRMKDSLYLNKGSFMETMGKTLVTFDDGDELWCGKESCPNYKQCSLTVSYKKEASTKPKTTETVIFWGIKPLTKHGCNCPLGYRYLVENGHKADCAASYSLCFSNPCGANGVCISTDGGFACKCKAGYTGKTCRISLKKKNCPRDTSEICKNEGSCTVDSALNELKCICKKKTDAHTPSCELTTRYFPDWSYASFQGIKNRWKLHLTMEFVTESANAVLFYNGRYSEKRDFIAIRLSGGQAELVLSLGVELTFVKSYVDGGVNTGSWVKVTVALDNKVGRIAVGDACDLEIGSLANSDGSKRFCAASKPVKGTFRSLDLTAPFFIGGYPQGSTMKLPNWDYVGCIRNLYVDHVFFDLSNPLKQNASQIGCPVKKNYCTKSTCANGGVCVSLIGGFRCDCKDGFIGKFCRTDVKSSSGAVRFEVNSLITFKDLVHTLKSPPASFTAEMTIKTRQTDSVLIYQLIDGLDAYLKIVGGSVAFFYQSKQMANLSAASVSDGNWHNIKMTLDSKKIQLSQDYERHHVTKIHQVPMDSKPVKMVSVGGVKQAGKVSQGFLGCLQGLMLSGVYIKTVGVNLKPGCQSTLQCGSCGTGTCSKEWDAETCHCPKGFTGPDCVDVCRLNPCLNDGLCRRSSTTVHGFTCECKPSFTGPRCETKMSTECDDGYFRLPGKWECGPCECDISRSFDPRCNKTSGHCFCKSGYFLKSNSCERCNCLQEGSINSECDRMTGQCRCKPRVVGLDCDRCMGPFEAITRDCLEINTSCPKSYSEKIWWSQIELGQTRIEECPVGTVGNAKRYCHPRRSWQRADLSACTSLEFLAANRTLSQLNDKTKNMTKELAVDLAQSLEYALTTGKALYERDIRIGYDAISKIIEYEGRQEKYGLTSSSDGKFLKNIMTSTSRLTEPDSKNIWSLIQKDEDGVVGLMKKMENLLLILSKNFAYVRRRQRRSVTALPPFSLASNNIFMEIQQFYTKHSSAYSFPMLREQWTGEYAPWKDTKPTVLVPPTIFNDTDLADREASLGLLAYKTLGDLMPSVFEEDGRRYNVEIYTDVVTVTIPGVANQTLSDNMTIIFQNKKNNQSTGLSCVYWNFTATSSRSGGWSTDGCFLTPTNGSTIVCQCNHMTTFAAVKFVDMLPPRKSAFKVQPLTYVTLSVSMAMILFTFLTYVCLSQLRSNANSIHKNLCAALFLAELVFIVGINRTDNTAVCRIIAILLHYFFSCVFSWMLVEAFHLYRLLSEKRNINYEDITPYYFIGWGAPVIVVGVTAGLTPKGYGNPQFCWISTSGQLLWTFTAPIMAMVAANLLIFVLAVAASFNKKSSARDLKHKNRPRCVTWGCMTNSAANSILRGMNITEKGIYIVLFYVLFNREVRDEYKNAYIRWKTGDKSYGKKRPRVKRTLVVDSSYRSQLAHLTATFNLSTSTTDSSTDGGRIFGKGRRDLASSTQPDSSDTSDEDTTKDPETYASDSETSDDDMPIPSMPMGNKGLGSNLASPNSTRSSNSNSAKSPSGARSPVGGKSASGARSPQNGSRTPDFKMANPKKLRTAPLYASNGPMHSTPSDNSDNSEKRKFKPDDDRNPSIDVTDVTVLNEEMDGPEDPLLSSLKRQRAEQSSSSDTSEVSSLPSVIRVGPGGKPQSILKKKSKYGNVTDSDSERRGKVRVRISDKSKKPLLNLNREPSE